MSKHIFLQVQALWIKLNGKMFPPKDLNLQTEGSAITRMSRNSHQIKIQEKHGHQQPDMEIQAKGG